MRRLSIIDLDTGHQPISNEDNSIWVVLNGEIYNYVEIRQDLQNRGHIFKTKSDTEIIVHLYEEKGIKGLDDLNGMLEQAKEIGSWGSNVYVKIPVTNTIGEFTGPILKELSSSGVRLNITAVFTTEQVKRITDNLSKDTPAIVSVFAGRIADTGLDPMPLMRNCLDIIKSLNRTELLWASPRELLNIIQADDIGCHIITATPEVIGKLGLLNKNLDQLNF